MHSESLVESAQKLQELFASRWEDAVVFPALLEVMPCLHFSAPPRPERLTRYLQTEVLAESTQAGGMESYGQLDALIIPTYVRENYIAPLRAEVEARGYQRIGVVYGRTCDLESLSARFPESIYTFVDVEEFFLGSLDNREFLQVARDAYEIARAASKYARLSDWLEKHAKCFLTLLVRNTVFARRFDEFVRVVGSPVLISSNEQVFPNSLFHWNAVRKGLEAKLLLHGFPTRIYAPFRSQGISVSDASHLETFTRWGVSSERMMLHVNPEASRAKDLVESLGAHPSLHTVEMSASKELLFLSQIQGQRIWNNQWFGESLTWIERFFRSSPSAETWSLRFRYHPHDSAGERAGVRQRFAFLEGRFIEDAYSLEISSIFASAVVSCSSTGIAPAHAMGRRCAFLWHPSMTDLHGPVVLDGVPQLESYDDFERFLQ